MINSINMVFHKERGFSDDCRSFYSALFNKICNTFLTVFIAAIHIFIYFFLKGHAKGKSTPSNWLDLSSFWSSLKSQSLWVTLKYIPPVSAADTVKSMNSINVYIRRQCSILIHFLLFIFHEN